MFDVRDGLYYTKDHEWIKVEGKVARFGIADYAQHEMGDLVYVEVPAVGTDIVKDDEIGAMESVKSVEPIYAPVSGKIIEVNEALADATDTANKEPYDGGWMAVIELSDPSEGLPPAFTVFLSHLNRWRHRYSCISATSRVREVLSR